MSYFDSFGDVLGGYDLSSSVTDPTTTEMSSPVGSIAGSDSPGFFDSMWGGIKGEAGNLGAKLVTDAETYAAHVINPDLPSAAKLPYTGGGATGGHLNQPGNIMNKGIIFIIIAAIAVFFIMKKG